MTLKGKKPVTLVRTAALAQSLGIKYDSVGKAIRRKSDSVPPVDFARCPTCDARGPLWIEK